MSKRILYIILSHVYLMGSHLGLTYVSWLKIITKNLRLPSFQMMDIETFHKVD